MTTASKSYSNPNGDYAQNAFQNDLYWPDKNSMVDMLKLDILEYVPISKSGRAGGTEVTSLSNIQSVNQVTQITNGVTSTRNRKKLSTVLLPIPNDIKFDDQLSWSTDNAGIVGKMAPALAAAAAAGGSNIGQQLSQLAAGGIPEVLLKELQKVPGAPSAELLTQGVGGKILNPYVEQVFKGIAVREFNFSWKLVPRNNSEQSRIHRIIKALRYYSLPNYSSSGGFQQTTENTSSTARLSDRWLTVPNIFDLRWVKAGTSDVVIQSLPKIKPCVLKSVSVNYTPDNVWATHLANGNGLSGPAPVAYDLNLSFAETEIITADNVLDQNGGY
jgi:hypothetical protein